MARKHTILDHPIIGYFVLFIFVMLFSSIGTSLIDNPLSNVIPGYAKEMSGFGTSVTSASGIEAAIGVILSVIIFTLWFRPDFKGVLGWRGFLWGIVVMLPSLIADYVGAAIDLYTFGLKAMSLQESKELLGMSPPRKILIFKESDLVPQPIDIGG